MRKRPRSPTADPVSRQPTRERKAQHDLFSTGRKEATTSRAIYVAFALATTLFGMSGAFAEPRKEQYELQERCGIRAEESFKNSYGGGGVTNTETGQNVIKYQNHYSATFNKCFFLEIVISINYKGKEHGVTTTMTLFDLNEHKDYGTFYMNEGTFGKGYGMFVGTEYSAPFPCKWNEQHQACHTESEWREWLRPYMEE